MLFDPISQQIIDHSMLHAVDDPNERKIRAAELIDAYQGRQLKALQSDLIRYTGNYEKIKPVCINIIRKIIDRLASIYRLPAKRTIEGRPEDQELFNEISRNARLNVKLKQVSRLTKLVKTCLVKVSFRSGNIALDVITPELTDIEVGQAPDDIKAVTLAIYKPNDTTYHKWTTQTFQILNRKREVIHTEPNIYGLIPFVVLHDEPPLDSPFVDIPEDLFSFQTSINRALADLLNMISMSSHGQAVSKGLPPGAAVEVGVNSVVALPADEQNKKTDFKFEDSHAKITETIEAIEKLIHFALMSYGIPISSFAGRVESSGVAKQVDSQELDEARQNDIEAFREYEQQIFTLIKTVHNTHSEKRFSENATLSTDFAELKPSINQVDQLEAWKMELELGLTSPVEIIMKKNPDLDRDHALAALHQIKLDNQSFSEVESL